MSRTQSSRALNKRNSKVLPLSYDEDEIDNNLNTAVMVEATVISSPITNNNNNGGRSMKKSEYDVDPDEFEEFLEQKQNAMNNRSPKKKDKSQLGRDVRNNGRNNPIGAPPAHHQSPLVSTNIPTVKAWPPQLRKKVVDALQLKLNERKADKYLLDHRWPQGLRETVFRSVKKLPLRFFIVDDSGSMILADGRRMLTSGTTCRLIKCTRWAELTESMTFMGELSECLGIPSEFRLLNGADPVIVGLEEDHGESMKFLREALMESPAGPTPLCTHITAVVQCIQSVEKELRANNQKAVVVIATDGESSDGNVAEALKPLTDLPVLVILRLCTEEQQVVDYWNNIDNQLELDIDVIDDQLGDAKQIHAVNGWMTYGEPMHRLREFGAVLKELDLIDESTLSSDQMRMLSSYIFCAGDIGQIPHPGVEWKAFIARIKEFNAREPKVFCPITQKMKGWIDIPLLHKFYIAESGGGGGGCTIS